jgi:amino acid transporter
MMPKSGGEEVYLRTAYPRPKNLLSFLFCWSMIMVARPGSAAADSVVFAQYMLYPFVGGEDSDPWVQRGMGLACITLITGINIFSTKLAVKIHDLVTIFKVIVLVMIAVTGFLVGTRIWSSVERPDNFTNAFQGAEYNTGVIATTLFNIFYSFDGWNNANYAVGDMKDPSKNLPKAAGLGVSLVCVLYLICNVSYLMVLPKDVMMESDALLAGTFFSYTYGDTMGGKVFPVFIALSAFGAVCAMVYSAARVIFAAAESGYFPFSSVFAKLHPTYKTPVNALLFHWVCVVILMIGPPPGAAFEFLVQFAQYPTWIFYGLAVLGLIRMRTTHPHFPRSFRVWIPLSVVFICVSIFLAIFPFVPSKNEMYPYYLPPLSGVVFLLIGIPLWYVMVKMKGDVMESQSVLKEFIDVDE